MNNLGSGGAEKALINVLKNLSSEKYIIDILLIVNEGRYVQEIPPNVTLKT